MNSPEPAIDQPTSSRAPRRRPPGTKRPWPIFWSNGDNARIIPNQNRNNGNDNGSGIAWGGNDHRRRRQSGTADDDDDRLEEPESQSNPEEEEIKKTKMPFPSLSSNKQGSTDPSSSGDAAETHSASGSQSQSQAGTGAGPGVDRQPSVSASVTPSRIPRKARSKLSLKNIAATPPRLLRGSSALLSGMKGSGSGSGGAKSPPPLPRRASSARSPASPPQSPAAAAAASASFATLSPNPPPGDVDGGGGAAAAEDAKNAARQPAHSGDTLESYVLPSSLRMEAGNAGAADHVVGLEVVKVSKNGKQQTRRLGIAPNNRAIYITTHKLQPQKGRVLGLLKKGGGDHDNDRSEPVKEVDLSRVVRVQLGQQSRRFVKARSKQYADATATPQSLSIIYRRSFNSTKDKLAKTMKRSSTNQIVMDAGEDSLDLIVPSKPDFLALTRTLEDLLAFYREEAPCTNPDHAWIEHHLVDMGKSLATTNLTGSGGADGGDDRLMVSCSDWVALCKRWNAPVTKGEAAAMYKAFCDGLAISNANAEGLEMFEVVRLLDVLRQRGLDACGEDPRRKLFQKIACSSGESHKSQAISAEEFLNFLHDRQKENKTTLQEVKDLFYQLNGHRVSPQLEDAISVLSPKDRLAKEGQAEAEANVSWEREYISWEAFGRYLLLESNDVFDPARAELSESCMDRPLNNYWINTSHDTYLRRLKASAADQKQSGKTDLQSYTLALYRGARAIELDVWDGPAGNNDPLVRFGVTSFSENTPYNKSSSSNSLAFADVILTISYFLQSEPQSFPVILLIENHCSLPFQEKMALDLEEILGQQNLLHRQDPTAKETDPLPSPLELRGKVVIKSKRPQKILGDWVVLNDDFDDENRESMPPSFTDYDSEDDIRENVVGFTSTGSIRSTSPQKHTAEQLFQTARSESLEATSNAKAVFNQLMDVRHHAQQSQNHADALLRDIGMSYEELKAKQEEGPEKPTDDAEEGTEVELCLDGRASKVKETADQAMEVARAFAESVEESRLLAIAAAIEARSETELFELAREDLTDKEAALAGAEEELRSAAKSNRDLVESAERALSEARSNREYAEIAERRVAAVRGLVDRSHDQAVSSETVAGTADAEAKISEQRASDAEARSAKARANEEKERRKAEAESKLEDELEERLIAARGELINVKQAVSAARGRADDAVVQAEKLTDEIREARSLEHAMSTDESLATANQKSQERRAFMGEMEKALADKLDLESSTRKLESMIDDLQRKAHLQAKVAASARRQADHSMSIADQLEEHALEEREAADLRMAACIKAKITVESSDAVLTSTEAQLAEAERAAVEADELALESRQRADQLAKEAEAIQDLASLEENVRLAKALQEEAHVIYEGAKESQEEALERSAKAKQVHETNCLNLANLERDAMAELLRKESAQQAESLAVNACENAQALSDQVDELETKCDEAKALAAEKSAALVIANRYKEKSTRVQLLSPSLAKSTLIHSTNMRNWDKSFRLPNYALHSIPDKRVVERAERGKEEWRRWVEFNKTHFSRTYPESASRNYNPLLPWAMGCQFVSMNFIRNKFMLLNDGRFRENGGQGYVLKPEYLREDSHAEGSESEDAASFDVDGALTGGSPRHLSIRILSGFCLPKSAEKKSSSSTINPFVRVTLYDGSPATPSPAFRTHVVEGNGLNPVWNGPEAADFACANPGVGVLLFAVYDHCNVTKTDLFVGASAMPVSCLREGYRCVSLFDSNNARSGAMKHASLFVKVKIES